MKRVGFVTILMLVLLVFTFSDSSAQIGFKGVGGHLGFVDGEGSLSGILFGGHVNLGEIIPGLALTPSFDYWSDSGANILNINGDVRYYFPTDGNIDFFAGGGLALVRVSVDDTTIPDPFNPGNTITFEGGSDTELGLNLGGGASIPLSDNLVGTAMLVYGTKGEQIKIMGGVTYMLGQ